MVHQNHSQIKNTIMKKINILITILFTVINVVFANSQNKAIVINGRGLYLTLDDFLNHRLSYISSDKIVLNQFTAASNIKVLINGETKKFSKKQVFGYHNINNEDFRFYKNELYQIVISEPWFVYKHYASSTVEGGKGNIKKESYYFSVKGNDELIPLTVENLKKSFPNNLKFHNLLDQVRSDADLLSYDRYRNELKIAYLYKQSL